MLCFMGSDSTRLLFLQGGPGLPSSTDEFFGTENCSSCFRMSLFRPEKLCLKQHQLRLSSYSLGCIHSTISLILVRFPIRSYTVDGMDKYPCPYKHASKQYTSSSAHLPLYLSRMVRSSQCTFQMSTGHQGRCSSGLLTVAKGMYAYMFNTDRFPGKQARSVPTE